MRWPYKQTLPTRIFKGSLVGVTNGDVFTMTTFPRNIEVHMAACAALATITLHRGTTDGGFGGYEMEWVYGQGFGEVEENLQKKRPPEADSSREKVAVDAARRSKSTGQEGDDENCVIS